MEESFRRNLSQGDSQEDGVEYAPSEEVEVANQLREKVRSQAQRLRNLEQYKILCEKRISEFCPNHPFPVNPDHLGKFPEGYSPQSSQSKRENKSPQMKVPLAENYTFPPPTTQLTLNQLQELYAAIYYQHSDVLKEKNNLEESLRAETLLSEEQRTYIEVLKQALEAKMENLGISHRDIDAFVDFTNTKTTTDNTRKEISKLQSIIADQEAHLTAMSEQLKKKNEENNNLLIERSESHKHLEAAAESLAFAEEELNKLEDEKNALLEYAEEFSHKEKEFKEEYEKILKEKMELEENFLKVRQILSQEQSMKSMVEDELEIVRRDKSKIDGEAKSSSEENSRLSEKIRKLSAEIEDAKQQIQNLTNKNESLQANSSTLSNTLRETQAELDALQENYNSLLRERNNLKESLEASESSIKELKISKKKSEEKAQELEESLIYKEREFRQMRDSLNTSKEDDLRQSVRQIDGLQKELQKAWGEQQEALKRELAIAEEISELQSKLSDKEEEIEKIKKEAQALKKEKNENRIVTENTHQELVRMAHEKEELEAELHRVEIKLSSEQCSHKLSQDEAANFKAKLEELNLELQKMDEMVRDRDNYIDDANYEIELLKKEFQQAREEADSERQGKTAASEELGGLRQEISRVTASLQEKEKVAKSAKSCLSTISGFLSSFGSICASASTYSSTISPAFKNFLMKYNENHPENTQLLEDWVLSTCKELELLIRSYSDLKQESQVTAQKLLLLQQRYDALSIDDAALKDRERNLRSEVEALVEEKNKLEIDRESSFNKSRSFQNEAGALKRDLQSLNEENNKLKDQLKYSASETIKWRTTAESDVFALKMLEDKANQILKEKKGLEGFLKMLQASIPYSDLQLILVEMMKTHGDIEICERERIRIEGQLIALENELRSSIGLSQEENAINARREIEAMRSQLDRIEAQIQNYKRKMVGLEGELKECGNIERRKRYKNPEKEFEIIQAQEQADTIRVNFEPESSLKRILERAEESSHKIVRYDPLISPQFAPNIESRLMRASPSSFKNRPFNPLRSTKSEII
ncbi:unnamed protein product [Blepharisma stoltei]|uniref:Uncharacterized protein n=1 Tax=Blepharisma stoltei TaxID=1481888 RepID=A0AAU9K217_9CILI|nr:unnamed protein product [Blepharisma stoltei]